MMTKKNKQSPRRQTWDCKSKPHKGTERRRPTRQDQTCDEEAAAVALDVDQEIIADIAAAVAAVVLGTEEEEVAAQDHVRKIDMIAAEEIEIAMRSIDTIVTTG